eukprot:jgi/Picsp_1/5099/NSC_02462-R1_ribosome-binding factor a
MRICSLYACLFGRLRCLDQVVIDKWHTVGGLQYASREFASGTRYGDREIENREIIDTDPFEPSKKQKMFGGRVYKAIQAVLGNYDAIRQDFLDAGICIKDIRTSPDNMKAFILWDTYKDSRVANNILHQHAGKLKTAMGKKLGSRRVPYLEFRCAQRMDN